MRIAVNNILFVFIFHYFMKLLDSKIANCCVCLIEAENIYMRAIKDVASKLKDPDSTYVIEAQNKHSAGQRPQVLVRGTELDHHAEISTETAGESSANSLSCSYLCSKADDRNLFASVEEV